MLEHVFYLFQSILLFLFDIICNW